MALLSMYGYPVQISEKNIVEVPFKVGSSELLSELQLVTPRQQYISQFILELKDKPNLSNAKWIESLFEFIESNLFYDSTSSSEPSALCEVIASLFIQLIETKQLIEIVEYWCNDPKAIPIDSNCAFEILEPTMAMILIKLIAKVDNERAEILIEALLNKMMMIQNQTWIELIAFCIINHIKQCNTTHVQHWVSPLLAHLDNEILSDQRNDMYYDLKLKYILIAMMALTSVLEPGTVRSFCKPLNNRIVQLRDSYPHTLNQAVLSLVGAMADVEPDGFQSTIRAILLKFERNENNDALDDLFYLSSTIRRENEVSALLELLLDGARIENSDRILVFNILMTLIPKGNKADARRLVEPLINMMPQPQHYALHLWIECMSRLAQKQIEIPVQPIILRMLSEHLTNFSHQDFRPMVLCYLARFIPNIQNIQEQDEVINVLLTYLNEPSTFKQPYQDQLATSLVTLTVQLPEGHEAIAKIADQIKKFLKVTDLELRTIAFNGLQTLLFNHGVQCDYAMQGSAEEVVLHKMQEIYNHLELQSIARITP